MNEERAKKILMINHVGELTEEIIVDAYQKIVNEKMQTDKAPNGLVLESYLKGFQEARDFLLEKVRSESKNGVDGTDIDLLFIHSNICRNAKDDTLKKEITEFFRSIMSMAYSSKDISNLKKTYYNGVRSIYQKHYVEFCTKNNIPKFCIKFDNKVYTINSFENMLDQCYYNRKEYVIQKINDLVENSNIDILFKQTNIFGLFVKNNYDMLWDYDLTLEEETEIFKDFEIKLIVIKNTFDANKYEYLELRRKISNLSDLFDNNNISRDELIERLDKSIIDNTFEKEKVNIEEIIIQFTTKHQKINRLLIFLKIKLRLNALKLNPCTDKEKYNEFCNMYECVKSILEKDLKQRLSFLELDCEYLKNLSFNDLEKDMNLLEKYFTDLYFAQGENPFVFRLPNTDFYLKQSSDDNALHITKISDCCDFLADLPWEFEPEEPSK